jgi:membrane-bound lytic murein transglycosylase B
MRHRQRVREGGVVAEQRRKVRAQQEGRALRAGGDTARLVLPAGAKGPAFLLRPNFSALLGYNAAFSARLAPQPV